ncbi:uncharacterized protein LOC120411003 [Corvus cornix cornix]|uniref:uncharacterized protein LOC120411003 n=1 Tax=Corvus cornix cornix TaxID=932674 RepID=UPI00194EB4DC|nr:uncharacterized protein LOC120411003 [Corvus cornix cornix]
MDLRAERQPLPTCEKSTIPVTYRTELAVAAAAAGNLLAAPDREGSAEPFSHTNPTHGLRWTRAAFCRSAPDKALSKPARGVCLRWLDTWSRAGQLFAAREGSRGVTAPRQGRSRRPGSGRSGLRGEQRARGARPARRGHGERGAEHGDEPGESSGRQQSGVCPLRNQRRGRDAVFEREGRVCELRLQYRLLAQAVNASLSKVTQANHIQSRQKLGSKGKTAWEKALCCFPKSSVVKSYGKIAKPARACVLASHGRASLAHCCGLENGRVPAQKLFGSRSRKPDLADLATSVHLCQESCDCCPSVLHRWMLQSHSVHDLFCHPGSVTPQNSIY